MYQQYFVALRNSILVQIITFSADSGQFSTGFYVFIAMMCFVVALTIVGVVHMIKHNCHCRVQCCFTCKEEEKEDINLDYGTYYSQDGERRDNIIEVKVVISHHDES